MIRLIATDLDGTLLTKEGKLPAGTFDRIRKLKEKGIVFVAASGRQYGNLRRLFFPVREEMAYIAENGACTVMGEHCDTAVFPRAMAEEIIRDILNAGMDVQLSVPEGTYVLANADRTYSDYLVYEVRNTVTVIEDPCLMADSYIKITGYHPTDVRALARPLQEKWRGKVNVDTAGDVWLDFTLSNKGKGLESLCRMLDIPLSDVAAFGDQFNDLSMLEIAGHPYVMESAPEGLKDRGFTLCSDVSRVLDRMIEGAL